MAAERLGLVKTSFIDYPGRVAAVLFTHGCNLRCPYCHNPECVLASPPGDFLPLEEIQAFLEKRKSILGGVCITGGEPFIHNDIPERIDMIHSFGLDAKIDTNGTFPERLASAGADFIDMDVKTSPSHYGRLLGMDEAAVKITAQKTGEAVRNSIEWLKKSSIPHRFRITAAPGIVDTGDMYEIAEILGPGETCLISGFNPSVTLDPSWSTVSPYSDETLDTFAGILSKNGLDVVIRHNHTPD